MATEVIHTKKLEDGSTRILLDEPHGINQAHRRVVIRVEGLKYDHKGKRVVALEDGTTEERTYLPGEEVGYLEYFLAGQREFTVPKEATSIEFDDGTYSLTSTAEAPVQADPAASV